MGLRARTMAGGAWVACALVIIASSCRDPTEVTLDITTQDLCGKITATAVYVSDGASTVDDHVQQKSPQALTRKCDGTQIGTLVVTPGATSGAVVVIAGYGTKEPTDCIKGNYVDCIIARRSFSFVSHTPLHIPIELDLDCLNVPCDPGSTCEHGECKSAALDCRSNGSCLTADGSVEVIPGGMLLPDGAPAPIDAGGTLSDGGPLIDAGSSDAGDAASIEGGGIDGGFSCPTGTPCCGPGKQGNVVYDCPNVGTCGDTECCAPGGATAGVCKSAITSAACANGAALCCGPAQCEMGQQCCTNDPAGGGACVLPTGTKTGRCYPVQATGTDGGGGVDAGACNGNPAACCVQQAPHIVPTLYHCGGGAQNDCVEMECCLTKAGNGTCAGIGGGTCNGAVLTTEAVCCDSTDCTAPAKCCPFNQDAGMCAMSAVIPGVAFTPGHCVP